MFVSDTKQQCIVKYKHRLCEGFLAFLLWWLTSNSIEMTPTSPGPPKKPMRAIQRKIYQHCCVLCVFTAQRNGHQRQHEGVEFCNSPGHLPPMLVSTTGCFTIAPENVGSVRLTKLIPRCAPAAIQHKTRLKMPNVQNLQQQQ